MTAYASPSSIREIGRTRKPHAGVAPLLHQWLGAVAREHRVQCGVRAMMALDDRMLSDIGLTRTEIGSAALYGRARSS
jgi:uncharacterized protein YjiS (DUF1127 family)